MKPVVLCILDGVGFNPEQKHNAVALAKMPFFDKLLNKYPHSLLNASGNAVGLPDGIMGNSEVGHITIGAGRIVNQFLRRFEIENLSKNKPLNNFITSVNKDGGSSETYKLCVCFAFCGFIINDLMNLINKC